jgi:hypothetical protein
MKRSRDADLEALNTYLGGEFASTMRYDEHLARFTYREAGVVREAGGLLGWVKALHYPHYIEGQPPGAKSRIKSGKPSNAAQGIRIDEDIQALVQGDLTQALHPMSAALLSHWQAKGHAVVAAQVPVRVNAQRLTKADVMTRDNKTGKLWVWEVKSGMPAALHDKQERMRHILGNVPCSKANQWALQCEYTRLALVHNAGLSIAGARVIQVWESWRAGGAIEVKEHRSPGWVKQIKL